jgi:outer membrane protein OmpA-like peptidoglycan-associated protein
MGAPYRVLLTLLLALAANAAFAAQYQIGDPIPPGAQGTVSPLSGDVREIVGMASAVVGRVDPLAAALKDLGAKVTDTEIRIEMSADVLFDFDKADIKQAAEPALTNVATVLQGYPRAAMKIEGHTDAKGSDSYNQNLSERRARAVEDWLKKREGLKEVRFSTRGLGAKQPIAPNTKPNGADNPEGRQKNRRVEIIVSKG